MDRAPDLSAKRVWVMAKGYHPDEGGMQTYAQGVATAYARLGAEVTVFTQTSAGPRTMRIDQIDLVDIGPGKSISIPLALGRAMRARKKRFGAAHFVHGTTWRMSVLPMMMRLRYIVTFHGREFMYARGATLSLMRRVAKRADRIVAVSHFTATRLADRLGRNIPAATVSWNGLSQWGNLRETLPTHDDTPLIFSLCRLEPRKNIAACVEACAALHGRRVRFRYVIAGRGPELDRVRELVRQHDLGDHVEVAGYVSAERAAELYREADLFLHPQIAHDEGRDFEGFGIAIADAMNAGCAAIVGAEGGAPELVEDGVSGMVVDGRNARSLEAALETLLLDRVKRTRMSDAGRIRAQELFTWGRHVALILANAKIGD